MTMAMGSLTPIRTCGPAAGNPPGGAKTEAPLPLTGTKTRVLVLGEAG
jgi:hypothetical protein